MHELRVNELVTGDRVVIGTEAQTILREVTSRADVWLGVNQCYYRVVFTGAYGYLTVLRALDEPHGHNVYCVVLYSGPEYLNQKSEAQLATYHAKLLLQSCSADEMLVTHCYYEE